MKLAIKPKFHHLGSKTGWSNKNFLFEKDFDGLYLLIQEKLGNATKDKVNVRVEIYLLRDFSFFNFFLLVMSI